MLMVHSFAGENQWRSKLSGGHSLLAKASNCLHVIKPGYQGGYICLPKIRYTMVHVLKGVSQSVANMDRMTFVTEMKSKT